MRTSRELWSTFTTCLPLQYIHGNEAAPRDDNERRGLVDERSATMAAEPSAAGQVLTHRHIFGLKGDVKRLIHFVEESTCMYPCGHNIILYNSETREQELIHGMVGPPTASEGITALAITPNRKYMAVAERSDRGVVNIYDAATRRRRKMLAYAELGSKEVADFCPQDSTVVCVTGDSILRFMRITENQFRPIPFNLKREPQNYLCHCWLPEDRLVAASDTGDLLLFEGFEFRMVLASSPSDGGAVNTIVFNIEGNATHITNLAISPSEENLLCATANNQMYTFTLSNTDILKEDSMNFELLSTSFHGPGPSGSAQITAMDVCVWKPLVATCGRDRSLRIWNYQERAVELMKEFPEEPTSVALHPSGLYVLAGFPDKLRLMSLLMDDIRSIKELPVKGCRECKFAHGGHAFAVVNNSLVQIIHTYTCEVVTNLRGHNARVRDGSKEGEHVIPRVGFLGGAASPDLSRVFSVSDDATLREFSAPAPPGAVAVAKSRTHDCALGCVDVGANQRILFAGTAEPGGRPGFILAHALLPQWETLEPQKYQCHSSEVSCLRLSHDGTFLFSGGHDGSLCMFEVHDVDQRGQVRSRERDGTTEFTEEILVTKSDLEEKSNQMQQLRNKVDELVLNNEYQLRLKDMKYKERLTETSDKFTFTSELQSDAQRYEQLMDDKRRMELEYEEKLRSLEDRHKAEFRDLEMQYDAKINTEVARYQALVAERETQNRSWDEDNLKLVDGHSAYVMELTSDYDAKIEEEHDLQRRLAAEKESMLAQFNKTKALIEEDADLEVEEVKSKYEAKLAAERQLTLRLKGENGLMKKKFSALTKDVEDQKEEIRSLHEKEKELIDNIKGLEKDIQGHKKEIREREETIADKEKRIYDLKKKNQELEKFKFVLDYKIKELKRQIEPRENEIADMRKQVEEMDMELEQYHKSNSALDLMIGELRLKMDGMQKEINLQRDIIAEGAAYISRFRRDLSATAAANLDKHKDLKLCVRELYKTYAEYNRQREHLERNAEALKRKIAKDLKMLRGQGAPHGRGRHPRRRDEQRRRENHRQNLKQEAVRAAAADGGGDPALGSHILNLESKAKILEDMLAAANGAAPELQQ
ncbi:hypothetical protein JL721_9775 [Aureococcus anophagefferens]|nr:hypothetical protein JL721_9775 [Aureococcus anophagefferens]